VLEWFDTFPGYTLRETFPHTSNFGNKFVLGVDVFTDNKYVSQDDNAPVHRARNTEKQENNIKCTKWPAQFPDLNLCENVWVRLKRALKPIAGSIPMFKTISYHIILSGDYLS
jgi:hypothetical protein